MPSVRYTTYLRPTLLALTALAILITAGPANAGDKVELTLHGGYRSGIISIDYSIACIYLDIFGPCPDMLRGEDDTVFGLTVDIPIARQWMLEVRVDRHSTFGRLTAPGLSSGGPTQTTFIPGGDLEITSVLVGGLRWWRVGNVEPFVSLSAGVADIDLDQVFFEPPDFFGSHLTVAAGGGVKLRPEDRIGVRLELRGIWFDLPGGDEQIGIGEDIGRDTAAEASAGVIIRF